MRYGFGIAIMCNSQQLGYQGYSPSYAKYLPRIQLADCLAAEVPFVFFCTVDYAYRQCSRPAYRTSKRSVGRQYPIAIG